MIRSLEWNGDALKIIDQTKLPHDTVYRELHRIEEVHEAIQKLRVRGAPAIGVAAAYGLYMGLRSQSYDSAAEVLHHAKELSDYLAGSRPTAVNLQWALKTITEKFAGSDKSAGDLVKDFLAEAIAIHKDDEERCRQIGENGSKVIEDRMTVLTHCNTGALATAGIGTAFGVIYQAHRQGKRIDVLVDETRPLLQGARLTMWELNQAGIPGRLITDNMAAYAMQTGKIDLVIVGADRIAANGDVANKIGTYSLAVLADYHGIPFYVAAPLSTFDFSIERGDQIPIEERDPAEVIRIWDQLEITVPQALSWNPAFDVTPSELITCIITEEGLINSPVEKNIQRLIQHTYQN